MSLPTYPPLGMTPAAPAAPATEAAGGLPARTTLASVPAAIDAAWWGRHAHLIHDAEEGLCLRFEAGAPREVSREEAQAPVPPEQAFCGIVGQESLVERLCRTALGARARGKPYPDVLVGGLAGADRRALARGIAAAAGQRLTEISVPDVRTWSAWLTLLAAVPEGSVLFVDEVQALPPAWLQVLLAGLERRPVPLTLDDGTRLRFLTLRLPRFTLVAGTSDEGAISASVRGRFGLREMLRPPLEAVGVEPACGACARRVAEAPRASAGQAPRRRGPITQGSRQSELPRRDQAPEADATSGGIRLDGRGGAGARVVAGPEACSQGGPAVRTWQPPRHPPRRLAARSESIPQAVPLEQAVHLLQPVHVEQPEGRWRRGRSLPMSRAWGARVGWAAPCSVGVDRHGRLRGRAGAQRARVARPRGAPNVRRTVPRGVPRAHLTP